MLSNILHTLFGATLVTIGVLVAALADRIRGIRFGRERTTTTPREPAPARAATPIQVVEPKPEHARAPRSETKMQSAADDVIAALVAAGYKKPVAAEATWGCNAAERATIEDWTGAALRRCARGGMS